MKLRKTKEAEHLARGRQGERLARRYLWREGYRIVEENFRVPDVGEIDLIAAKGDILCFVEVKTRGPRRHGDPHEAVDARKQNRLRRAARFYLEQFPHAPPKVRYDVVSVSLDAGSKEKGIKHFENAF